MTRTDENGSLRLLKNGAQPVERGERLTQQLLAFARKQDLLPKAFDLNHVLERVINLLQRSTGTVIHIETRKEPEVAGPRRPESDRGRTKARAEGLKSAHLPRCGAVRRRPANRTHSRHSALGAGAALSAPKLSLAEPGEEPRRP
jgi:hypothetical protein